MIPVFRNTRTDGPDTPPSVIVLRKDVKLLADQLGDSAGAKLIGAVSIGTSETPVPHGQAAAPHWRAYDLQGPAIVYQTKPADGTFLYLAATAPVVVSIEVL